MDFDYNVAHRCLMGPAWRWKLAEQLPARRSHRLVQMCDEHVRGAHHYQRLCRSGAAGEQHARALYPLMAGAEELSKDDAKVALLKIAVLGGLDRKDIADRFGLEEPVIEAWEALFFDVQGMREAVGWLHVQVIKPERIAGRDDLAARLKFAVAVGPAGARAVLNADSRMPLDEGQRLFDRRLKLHLKFDAAMEMPAQSNREKMFFIRACLDMRQEDNRLRLKERKLAQRCQEALDKHELAKIRAEIAQKRADRRAAARAHKEQERGLIKESQRKLRQNEAALHMTCLVAETQAAAARAAASPLAQLKWYSANHMLVGESTAATPLLHQLPAVYKEEPLDMPLPAVLSGTYVPLDISECTATLVGGHPLPAMEAMASLV